jgi:hypothetical protein
MRKDSSKPWFQQDNGCGWQNPSFLWDPYDTVWKGFTINDTWSTATKTDNVAMLHLDGYITVLPSWYP